MKQHQLIIIIGAKMETFSKLGEISVNFTNSGGRSFAVSLEGRSPSNKFNSNNYSKFKFILFETAVCW